jgi:penicillin-binding protein 2
LSSSGYRDGRLSAGSDPIIEPRLGVIAVAIITAFAIFILRLFQLQIVDGADLRSRSERNFVRNLQLEAPRGDVLDRKGRTLATARPAYRVQVIPNELHARDATFQALGKILSRSPEVLNQQIGRPSGPGRFRPVVLGGDLSYEHFTQIESHRFALPGVVTDIGPLRLYAEGELAAHLLGTIGEIAATQLGKSAFNGYRAGEIVGQFGIEQNLELHLRGRAGGRNVVVDVAGREIELLEEIPPIPGGRAVLTLDLDLQQVAEESFRSDDPELPDKMGAVVAMDPRTGEILVMASRPTYDPNSFSGGIDSQTWERLTADDWHPLRNRAISGQYSPGSTYKPIVALAGLAEGVITPEDKVYCPGHYRLGRRVYRCWKRGGHGAVGLSAALRGSCDVYFYELGVKLGIDRIAKYATAFGLGRRTGIGLAGEQSGLVPTKEWKEGAKGEVWIKGETVSAAIGQGYNLVTPLQLAFAYAAIANGGFLVTPQLVKRIETWDGELIEEIEPEPNVQIPVSKVDLDAVKVGLVEVVQGERGTGARAKVEGIEVAGKTGTTQVVSLALTEDLEPEDVPVRYRDHALFAAFAPAEDPEIVIAVLVEHAGGGGGSIAAPIAQKVLARYFELRDAKLEVESGDAAEGIDGQPPQPPESPRLEPPPRVENGVVGTDPDPVAQKHAALGREGAD